MLKSYKSIIKEIQRENAEKEVKWSVDNFMRPEMESINDALTVCLNLLNFNSTTEIENVDSGSTIGVKLPFSSTNSEVLKGILVRDGASVSSMWLTINEPHFNKVVSRLISIEPIPLPQVSVTAEAISNAIEIISHAQGYLDESSNSMYEALIAAFRQILNHIRSAKVNLQLPVDPSYVFPKNVISPRCFNPQLDQHVAIDFYISQAELCIDLKYLHLITEKPWCQIFEDGRSYVDKLRDEMKSEYADNLPGGRRMSQAPINLADIENRMNSDPNAHSTSVVQSILSTLSLKNKPTASDYITRCVTFDNRVVSVQKKIEVSSPDPVLISTLSKLEGIENLVKRFLENIESIYVAL